MSKLTKETIDITVLKLKKIYTQFWRYFLVALSGLCFDFGTLVLLKEVFNVHYLFAAAVGFSFGLLVTYYLSELWVFSNPKIKSRITNFVAFGMVGIVGLGLLTLIMWLLTSGAGLAYVLSKVVATAFVYIWNFEARRRLYHN